ncbi:hypothetical protein BQ8482_111868 [Mesorhizobium delmotii]|uniref:Uncharacterized protein n=1 Tax=Mesorhizobium delmotii TaxID=1631247 RepID=A0A2P9AFQ3_9HYPH|nr:hypothetical protein BQ8482_111868 [Mesorhizobium delmotii]
MDICSPSSDRTDNFDSDASGDPAASEYIEPHNRVRAGSVAGQWRISQAKFSTNAKINATRGDGRSNA